MARRSPAAHLCLRVGARYEVAFVPFPARAPMFVIGTGSTLISVTLPEQLEAGHVDFARQLAAQGVGVRGGGRAPVPGPAAAAGHSGPLPADARRRSRCWVPGRSGRTWCRCPAGRR